MYYIKCKCLTSNQRRIIIYIGISNHIQILHALFSYYTLDAYVQTYMTTQHTSQSIRDRYYFRLGPMDRGERGFKLCTN